MSAPSEAFDVAVLGAGIAGLLMAAELSRTQRVLVVEQARQVPANKYWLTDAGSLSANPSLSQAVDCRYDTMEFRGCDGRRFTARGDYVLWDTPRLTSRLHDVALANGACFLFDHRFVTLRHERERVVLTVNARELPVRLVVDCMGHASPIVQARRVVDVHGYYALFGATFELLQPLSPVGLDNLALSSAPVFVEAFPTGDGRVHVVLIRPTRTRCAPASLAPELKALTRHSRYASHLRPSSRSEFLGGVVPVGRLRTPALDRIFFFGEAGQSNPAASGTALTRMLYTHAALAAGLSRALDDDRLGRSELCRLTPPTLSALNRRLQLALFDEILGFDSDAFAGLVGELVRLDDSSFLNDLMFAKLSFSAGAGAALVARLLRARCFRLLRVAARTLVTR